MPQPLSSKKPIQNWRFGPQVLSDHPNLARYIGEVVGTGACIEHHWAEILASVARADPRAVVAMHQALSSTSAQRAAFEAVAAVRLSEENKTLFEAVKLATKGYTKVRNTFCHHLWGDSEELPGALLLINPVVPINFTVSITEPWWVREGPSKVISFDTSKIMVYEEDDFSAAAHTMQRAFTIIGRFAMLLSIERLQADMQKITADPSMRDKARAQLVAEPEVAQALQHLALQKCQLPRLEQL